MNPETEKKQYDMDVELARFAVKQELQKKQKLNQPIAKYDIKTQKVYLEKSDGTRQEVGGRLREGRLSERRKKKA